MSAEAAGPRQHGYEEFFGFAEPPFSLSVNPRFRFASASHDAALTQVTYALERREPVVVVTGEIGMGKTLLCRTVVERLPRKTFLSVINDPMLGSDDLLRRILEDFGVMSADPVAAIQPTRHDLVHALEKFLASLAQIDAHAVAIIDEAQHVQTDVLEQVRLLANVHDDRGTLLQIVLVGQPDLHFVLQKPELQQLRQRVTRSVSLDPLTDDEVARYIAHRLTVARATSTRSQSPGAHELARAMAEWNEAGTPATFTDDAIRAVARISHGVPRLVNLLCDRALEAAFAQGARTADATHVATARADLQLPEPDAVSESAREPEPSAPPAAPRRSGALALAAVLAIVAIVAVAWLGRDLTRPTPAPAAQPARTSSPAPAAAPVATPPAVTPPPEQPRPVESPPPAAPPPAAQPTAPAANGASDASASTPGPDAFEIVVASFRTESRATDVAAQVGALGVPVHQRSIGGWQQVIAGPFPSRTAADDAQQALTRGGFGGTRVVHESR